MTIFSTDRHDPRTWREADWVADDVVQDVLNEDCDWSSCGRWLARERQSDGAVILYKAMEVRQP